MSKRPEWINKYLSFSATEQDSSEVCPTHPLGEPVCDEHTAVNLLISHTSLDCLPCHLTFLAVLLGITSNMSCLHTTS